jgi:uncharacterized cupredoxin-like copper-binding protein
MRRLRLRVTVPVIVTCVAVGVVASLAPAALNRTSTVKSAANQKVKAATVITVTAGKPSELAFKVSKTSMVTPGMITFKVTNMGVAYHNFRICAKPVAGAANVTNACAGKTTPLLKHGQSATLTVLVTKTGKYEFLCTVSGHAAAGMKGLLGVGVTVAGSEQKAAATPSAPTSSPGGSTTPVTTTTSKPGSGGGGSSNPCTVPGQTIATSGNADADGDELGTEPDDNDGCV